MKVIGSIKINKSKKLVMALIRSPKNLEKFINAGFFMATALQHLLKKANGEIQNMEF